MAIIISPKIAEKLQKKHSVSHDEVTQCFANRDGRLLVDTREDHASDPPTLWFVAETDYGRLLKIAFVQRDGDIYLRTAYQANAEEIRIYEKYGK
ncbi:MAG: hypothetical protein KUL88_07325 [Rhizobium sp.]|nr:hypothetical protein [Rhizobium sp.]